MTKQPYHAPTVTDLGDVKDLTQGNGFGNTLDQAPYSTFPPTGPSVPPVLSFT